MAKATRRKAPAKKPIRTRKRIIDERITGRDDHGTPEWLIKLITDYKPIGLDPAGGDPKFPASQAAERVYRVRNGDDGLRDSWRGYGLVFCNPEYGTIVRKWMRKAVEEFEAGPDANLRRGVEVPDTDECIMLVAARVDSQWFRHGWRHAGAVLLFDRRLTFIGEPDPAKFPSAMLYFGNSPASWAFHFRALGTVLYSRDGETIRGGRLELREVAIRFPEPRTRRARKAVGGLA